MRRASLYTMPPILQLSFPSLGQLKAEQAVDANRHERKRKQLPLVEAYEVLHVQFPRFLHLFEILYKEAEGEDGGEAEPEEVTSAHLVGIFAIEPQSNKEKEEIGYCFIELSWMAGEGFSEFFKDKAPSAISGFAHNLRVHEIAQTDAASRDGSGNGDVVEHAEEGHFRLAHIEPQGYHKSCRATVRS